MKKLMLTAAVCMTITSTPVSIHITPSTTMTRTTALAHSWYPVECCSGRDCMRVDRIEHTADGGMRMFANGIHVDVPKGFTQRLSRDNDTHVCVRENGDGSYAPRCVFIPAGV